MSAAGAVAAGRRAAESRMVSRVTIRRATGRATQDESTGEQVPTYLVTHTDLPFRLAGTHQGDSPSRTVDVAGSEIQVALRTGHMPVGTPDVIDGDLIEITSGENAGTVWRIVESDRQDQATALRVPVAAEQHDGGW